MPSSAKDAAEAFTNSYAAAMEMSLQPSTTIGDCAKALVSHYSPQTVIFAFGQVIPAQPPTSSNPDPWQTMITQHLARFDKSGIGWKIHKAGHRVEVYSEGSAQCWITWEIEPKAGGPFEGQGWKWENIYGWRRAPGDVEGKGWWEYFVSDHEMGELEKRVPGFMTMEV